MHIITAGGQPQNHRKEGSEEFKIFFPSLYLGYRMGIQTPQFVRNKSRILGRSRGGVRAPVEKYFRNFALWRNTFCPKSGIFFEIFEMYLHTTPQKSLFIAFLLTNFPKISKKVLKNFSRRLRRRKCGEIPQFFRPDCGKIAPPPLRGHPPISLGLIVLINEVNFCSIKQILLRSNKI